MTIKQHRLIQWIAISLILFAGVGWYYHTRVQSAAKINASQNVSLTNGLIGQWSFDGADVSGTTAYDRSGSANNGTLINGPAATVGKVGQALSFDGTDDYIRTASIQGPQTGGTWSSWVNTSDFAAGNGLIISQYEGLCTGYGNSAYIQFAYLSTGGWFGRIQQSRDTVYIQRTSNTGTISNNTWYHVVMVWDGGTTDASIKLYVNGIRVDTTDGGVGTFTAPYSGSIPVRIGSQCSVSDQASAPVKGKLDEVRMYNRALSAAEVAALYQSGVAKINVSQNINLTNGLVGQWSFDGADVSGTTAYDRSGSGNNGTLTNSPTTAIGKVGQALSFDGTDDYVGVGSGNPMANQIITISAWVKSPSYYTGYALVKGNDATANSYGLEFSGGGVYMMSVNSAGSVDWLSGGQLPVDVWHHVVGIINGNAKIIYVDGSQTATGTFTGTISDSSNSLWIGKQDRPDYTYPFTGSIDEVRIYNRVLSTAEVAALYRSGVEKINASQNTNLTNGLVGQWSFDGADVSGTTAYDRSGQGNNGTLVNAPTPTIGKIGQGLSFNGTNQRMTLATDLISTSAFTLSAWVKTTTSMATGPVIWKRSNSYSSPNWGNLLRLSVDSGTLDVFIVNNSYTMYQTGGTAVNDGNWHLITGVFDSSANTLKAYMDGAQSGSTTTTAGTLLSDDTYPLRIGMNDDLYLDYFPGSIDEVRIYNRALSAAEVADLYNLGR